ncbi:MAG: AI-2E family transporter [Pirellulales bacterium]
MPSPVPAADSSRPPADGFLTRRRGKALALAALTAIGLYLCFLMARPFLAALVWAVALAVVTRPVAVWLQRKGLGPAVSASLTVSLVTLLLLAPTLFVGYHLAREAAQALQRLKDPAETARWQAVLEQYPRVKEYWTWTQDNLDLQPQLASFLQQLSQGIGGFISGSLVTLVQLLLMLCVLFYLYRDEQEALRGVRLLLPLSDPEADVVFRRVNDTLFATVYGRLAVALMQGMLGGLMFWWLGLSSPLLWGLVMGLLSVLPYLGSFVVWAPVALLLLAEGNWIKALVLTVWGTVVIGLADNLIYPIVVGDRLRMHSLVALFSLLGGLAVFGAAGLVLGPAIVSVTLALLEIWRRRTAGGAAAETAA